MTLRNLTWNLQWILFKTERLARRRIKMITVMDTCLALSGVGLALAFVGLTGVFLSVAKELLTPIK